MSRVKHLNWKIILYRNNYESMTRVYILSQWNYFQGRPAETWAIGQHITSRSDRQLVNSTFFFYVEEDNLNITDYLCCTATTEQLQFKQFRITVTIILHNLLCIVRTPCKICYVWSWSSAPYVPRMSINIHFQIPSW